MPKSKKRPAKSGNKSPLPTAVQAKKYGFDPKQSRLPSGLKNQAAKGGRPKLFPGRTGGR